MINVLFVGTGLSISLMLFMGLGTSIYVGRIFSEVTPYLINQAVYVPEGSGLPYFDKELLEFVLDSHFSNLDSRIGKDGYDYVVSYEKWIDENQHPTRIQIDFTYESLFGDGHLHKGFTIVKGEPNE